MNAVWGWSIVGFMWLFVAGTIVVLVLGERRWKKEGK